MLAGKVAGRKAAWLAERASCCFLSGEERVNGRELVMLSSSHYLYGGVKSCVRRFAR